MNGAAPGLKSSPTRYGSVAIAIHWLTALAILGLLTSGLIMEDAPPEQLRGILPVHATVGTTVLALTLFRIGWWLWGDRRPAPLPDQPKLQERVASAVHLLLYAAIIVLAASGIATLALSGAIPALLGGTPLHSLEDLLPRLTHELVSKLLIGLLVLHIGAALYHQFIRRDRLLGRMGIGPV